MSPYVLVVIFKLGEALSSNAICSVLYTPPVYITDRVGSALLIKLLPNNMQMGLMLCGPFSEVKIRPRLQKILRLDRIKRDFI